MSQLLAGAITFAVVLPAIILHEVSHGYVAYLLGDKTARAAGRLSLNPLRHIDPFGTVLMPLLLAFSGLPVFGYAKPVPINPYRMRSYRQGMALTGLAGPATNLILAAVSGLVVRLVVAYQADPFPAVLAYLAYAAYLFCRVNLVLMFFNLIPIPPFDGSRVLPLFLTDRGLGIYHTVERYGFLIILALLWFGRPFVDAYFGYTADPLLRLFTGVAGLGPG